MGLPLLKILTEIARDKRLKLELIIKAFEDVIRAALKKKYFQIGHVRLDINNSTGEIKIMMQKRVCEYPLNDGLDISIKEAMKIKPDVKPGDYIEVEVPFEILGRNAALTAKQELLSRVRDVEKETVAEEYKSKIGSLVSGTVQKVDYNYVLISSGRAEFIMPRSEQIPGEIYKVGDTIQFVVSRIKKTPYGSQIIVSRASANFLRKILETEIPEIFDGTVQIKKIVREAGFKSKIAVSTDMENVDPVGACVGMKGQRIQSIMSLLNGEKMDIILWSSDITVMAMRALTPGRPKDIILDKEKNKIYAILPDDQISVTMGKGKVNLKLAAKLLEKTIEIVKESEYQNKMIEKNKHLIDIHELDNISENIISKLINAGLETVQDIVEKGEKYLLSIPGIGNKTAKKIISKANELLKK